MYANLKVTIVDTAEVLFAWQVEHDGEDGATVVHLDSQNGIGNYAEPNGTRRLDPGIPFRIEADF